MAEFKTKDGVVIIIDKGGEQIPDNTYGFEIEFCTHDNSVFAFTHMDVAAIQLSMSDQTTHEWKLETDSGNVLEAVTSILQFKTVADAIQARDALAAYLARSVFGTDQGDPSQVNAVTFRDWADAFTEGLGPVLQAVYPLYQSSEVVKTPWLGIKPQLIQENVDDGINIKAGRKRFEMNENSWDPYVDSTVLAWCEKDWGRGYLSQLNMPMTLEGFFLYIVTWKMPRAEERMKALRDVKIDGEIGRLTLPHQVENWFWMNAIATACNTYLQILYKRPAEIRDIQVDELSLLELKRYAFVYLVAYKVLTGALGALSEPNQLALQNVAWDNQSTRAMVDNRRSSYPALVNSQVNPPNEDWRDWLPYHSHLKDLLSLWFKGALWEVVSQEDLDGKKLQEKELEEKNVEETNLSEEWYTKFAKALGRTPGIAWENALSKWLRVLQSKTSSKQELNVELLSRTIARVETDLARDLARYAPRVWNQESRPYFEFTLPPVADRPFLHYSAESPWEGRYDTMVAVKQPYNGRWTYLIEHRFH